VRNGAIFSGQGLGMTSNRENQPAEHLGLLCRVAQTLLREGEYGELISGLLDTLIEGLGADRGFVVRYPLMLHRLPNQFKFVLLVTFLVGFPHRRFRLFQPRAQLVPFIF